jgi:hypothetical protein
MQAILWFVRKRMRTRSMTGNLDMFSSKDMWKTVRDVDTIKPYPDADERAINAA